MLCDRNLHSLGSSRILVVGDGDLSYSSALLKQSCCPDSQGNHISVTATVLETKEAVEARYSGSEESIAYLEKHPNGCVEFGVDATSLESSSAIRNISVGMDIDVISRLPFDTFIF